VTAGENNLQPCWWFKPEGGYGGFNDRYIDLRVDDHPEPIKELIRLHGLYKLYFYKTKPENILKIEGRARGKNSSGP